MTPQTDRTEAMAWTLRTFAEFKSPELAAGLREAATLIEHQAQAKANAKRSRL